MFSLIPTDMEEVAAKLKWALEQGQSASETSVIQEAILDQSQDILNGALEGPYWKVKWQDLDHRLVITDIMNEVVGTVTPINDSFVADFKKDSHKLLRDLTDKINEIVRND